MTLTLRDFCVDDLRGDPRAKTALLINPPVYDTQYWAQWAQPYGLLRIGALLKKRGYKRVELFDFMETNAKRKVPQHRINPGETYEEQDMPARPLHPYTIAKKGHALLLNKYHFGRPWPQFEAWLAEQGFDAARPPDEIWISATMTYWWESVRDLTVRLKRLFGGKTTILLGGIYPTLVPEHAARMTLADLIVVGEVEEANDLWPDLSLYERPPAYAVITPSRGCPYNCAYCAQRTINQGRQTVEYRPPSDIVAEMRHRYETYGIREFAFYSDFLLWEHEQNLQQILQTIVTERLPFRLHAPEGLDTRYLSQSQRLVDLMKEARFEKLYLPCESADDGYLRTLNRRHVRLDHFIRAAQMAEKAGFRMRNLEVNAFVLYGLPRETIDQVVKTTLVVSDVVGSIIPMLFTPVPTTQIYAEHLPYFAERGWDRDLHMLNGKLFPFLGMNQGTIEDYVDLQRLMFMLNTHYRSRSFRIFGDSRVSAAFRESVHAGFERIRRRDPEAQRLPGMEDADLDRL
ncbi:MAG TPA: B12-binding domain-containing radical SAM protein [Anaerolineae bacterium]|nr:B12-binding domain-containing radical SAM protein [Anaerolineae bacterium]